MESVFYDAYKLAREFSELAESQKVSKSVFGIAVMFSMLHIAKFHTDLFNALEEGSNEISEMYWKLRGGDLGGWQ